MTDRYEARHTADGWRVYDTIGRAFVEFATHATWSQAFTAAASLNQAYAGERDARAADDAARARFRDLVAGEPACDVCHSAEECRAVGLCLEDGGGP